MRLDGHESAKVELRTERRSVANMALRGAESTKAPEAIEASGAFVWVPRLAANGLRVSCSIRPRWSLPGSPAVTFPMNEKLS